jgi:hypothetical protein
LDVSVEALEMEAKSCHVWETWSDGIFFKQEAFQLAGGTETRTLIAFHAFRLEVYLFRSLGPP